MTLDAARYLSPEQAIGEPATSESDVYALALILFEAVTGSAAYEGTTPEAILRARLDTPLPVRLELGTLDMVLAQAAVPDPRLRLNAEQFSSRLGAVVGDASPLVVRPGSEEMPLLSQFAPLSPRNSIGFNAPSAEQVTGSSPIVNPFPRVSRTQGVGVGSTPRGPVGPVGRTPRFERSQYDLPRTTSRRNGFLIAAIIIVVLAVAAGIVWKAGVFKSSYAVPNLVGMSTKQASTAIASDGFTLDVIDVHSAKVPKNQIVSQVPLAGAKAKSGAVIDVHVSKGPAIVTLPTSIVGETCNKAQAQLTALHVVSKCPAARRIYSNVIPVDHVARVLYERTLNPLAVPRGATVILQRSKGTRATTTTTTTPPATTTTTSPTSGTTTTTPTSTGPRAVPNVIGDDYAQADAAMKKAVLYFTTTGHDAGTTKWTKVLKETPAVGTMVPYKSSVTLTVQ
jgi:hypothetical protein